MTMDEAHNVLILLRWMGWKLERYDVVPSDAFVVDALAALVDEAARKALIVPIPPAEVYSTFERLCERLRGTAEAELVCEALDRDFDLNAALSCALGRWKATR